jgi:hypothetical protein
MVQITRADILIWRAALPLAVLVTVTWLATLILAVPFLLALGTGLAASIGATAVVDRGSLRGRAVLAMTVLGLSLATVLMPLAR